MWHGDAEQVQAVAEDGGDVTEEYETRLFDAGWNIVGSNVGLLVVTIHCLGEFIGIGCEAMWLEIIGGKADDARVVEKLEDDGALGVIVVTMVN